MQDVWVDCEGVLVSKDNQSRERVGVPKGQETANIEIVIIESSIGATDGSRLRIG